VPRVFLIFFWPWGPKLLQLQNLENSFIVFFLRGLKSLLWESWGAKTTIKPNKLDTWRSRQHWLGQNWHRAKTTKITVLRGLNCILFC